jgi:transketolase
MASDPTAVFITGDLGFNALEGLAKQYGKRFLNAGVAEQNMMGMAAGMAMAGFTPWVYSIAPFVTYRCLEQIRNDVCLHNLPVRIVGNGGGYTYGLMGSTHHTLEDMAALKALPNIAIYFPCTNAHVEVAVAQIKDSVTPSYLRLAVSGFPSELQPLHENPTTLTRKYCDGSDLTIVGIGHATQIVLRALSLGLEGASVFGIAKFPISIDFDAELFTHIEMTRKVLVIEEHYASGNIAESLRMLVGHVDGFEVMSPIYSHGQKYGTPNFLLRQAGLTPERVIEIAHSMQRCTIRKIA